MFIGLVISYLALFLICAIFFSLREGYWSPITVFGITAFYYYLGLPLELYVRGEEIFAVYPSLFLITDESRLRIALCTILALLGFAVGHSLSGIGRVLPERHRQEVGKIPKSLIWLTIGSFSILFLVYGSSLFQQLSYYAATERRTGDFFFGFITKNCLVLAGLLTGTLIQRRDRKRYFALLLLAPIVLWGFYTSDKNPLLIAALSLSTVWVGIKSRSVKYLYFYCAAATLAVACLPLFSAFRADQQVEFRSAITDFSVERTDARGPLMSLSVAMANEEETIYGQSYLQGLVAWVPRAIWPDRPIDLAQTFAIDNIPNWKEGLGLGYSLLAEGYVNFGYFGVFCHYLVLAFVMGRIWRGIYGMCARSGNTDFWRALIVIVYFQLLVLMHRGPMSQIVQISMHELLLPAAFYWLLDHRRTSSRSRFESKAKEQLLSRKHALPVRRLNQRSI